MEKYYIPNPVTRKGFDEENLAGLYKFGVIPQNVRAFAGREHWLKNSSILPSNGSAKFWRDNRAVWSPEEESFDYIFPVWTKSAPNFSDYSFNIYSPSAAAFYRAYVEVGTIKNIPLMRKGTLTNVEARRMSFANGVPAGVPIGQFLADPVGPIDASFRGTFPSDCVMIFEGDEIFVCKIEEFIKEFPIRNVSLPPGDTFTDDEFVDIAKNLLANPRLTNSQKRAEIKKIV